MSKMLAALNKAKKEREQQQSVKETKSSHISPMDIFEDRLPSKRDYSSLITIVVAIIVVGALLAFNINVLNEVKKSRMTTDDVLAELKTQEQEINRLASLVQSQDQDKEETINEITGQVKQMNLVVNDLKNKSKKQQADVAAVSKENEEQKESMDEYQNQAEFIINKFIALTKEVKTLEQKLMHQQESIQEGRNL